MPYAHIDPSIYKQIARAIISGQTDITFPDPFVSAIDTGLQVTISGTVTITPDAPPDPTVGYEGCDNIDLSRISATTQQWDDISGTFKEIPSDFTPDKIFRL